MISRQEAGAVLERMQLRPVGQHSWSGLQQVRGRVFTAFAHLRPVYIQVQVHLNLLTPCNQPALHQYFTEVNAGVVVGKFVVGPEQQGARPVVLSADLPAGTEQEYTTPEALSLLFQLAFKLVDSHYDKIEALVRAGCAPTSEAARTTSWGLLSRLRASRTEETNKGNNQEGR